jgi:hypothetical protein
MRLSARRIWTIALGALVMVALGETAVGLFEPELPPASIWPTPETQIKQGQMSHIESIDVVFLGSSITEAAVDPAALRETAGTGLVYNAALPFSTPFSNELWLDDVILRRFDPSLVVIGLPAWESAATPDSDPLLAGIQAALDYQQGHQWTDRFALFRNSGVASEWDQRRARETLADSGSLTDLGQQTGYLDRHLGDSTPLELPTANTEMSDQEADAIGRMITRLSGLGIASAVMIEPGHYPGSSSEVDEDGYIASVQTHASEWGVPIWDTYHMGWPDSMFADKAHFNRLGTAAFTQRLAGMVGHLKAG